MGKLWTSRKTGITYDVNKRDAFGNFERVDAGSVDWHSIPLAGGEAGASLGGLLQAAGVIAVGATATAVALVWTIAGFILISAAAVIGLSNWPLMPLLLMAGALVCLAVPRVRRLAGARRIVAMICLCVVLFAGTICSVLLATRHPGFATFVRLPWVAVAAIAAEASPLGWRCGRLGLVAGAVLTVSSLLFWLMSLGSPDVRVDQIIATTCLAVVFCQAIWWRAASRIRRTRSLLEPHTR